MFFSSLPSLRPLIWLILIITLPVKLCLAILFVPSVYFLFKTRTVRMLSGMAFYVFLTCAYINLKPETVSYGARSDERSILIIESLKTNVTNWHSIEARDLETNEHHLIRFQSEDKIVPLDTLIVQADWKNIEPSLIKGAFNPKSYYGQKKIQKEAFVQKYVLVKGPRGNSSIAHLKSEFNTLLSKLTPEHQALCSGMILGDKTAIEREVIDQFKACGLMHILAVSGMHVGLLASLPLLVLSFMPKNWLGFRLLLKLISIVGVWFFAYFVGLGPSVVRSSIMFTAFMVSSQRSQLSSKINLLCATAFTMLLIEPSWLFELGFQLSFIAVLGILLLGSMLSNVYSGHSWLVKKFFDIVNISLSAQLFTLPLTVYHFHEFPTYFLLGNLAIAPLLVVSIYLCLLLIVLNLMGCGTTWLIAIIDHVLSFSIRIAKGIAELPNAVLKDLHIGPVMVFFLFLAIGIVVLRISSAVKKNMKILHLVCCMTVMAFLIRLSTLANATPPNWLSEDLLMVEKPNGIVLLSSASEKKTSRIAEQLEKQKGMQIKVVYSTDTLISTPFEVGVFHNLLFLEDSVYVSPFNSKRINSLIEGQHMLPRGLTP